jgi:hypothetical protein
MQEQQTVKPLRVLCLDGGGMRGIYTAAYLSLVSSTFARKRSASSLDVGAGFDLITGTSTGAIIGCGLALGVPLDNIIQLYRRHGKAIFPRKLPDKLGANLAIDLRLRPKALRKGEKALRAALDDCFGTATLGSVYAERKIALAIPAVDMAQHRSWVFKTPHLPTTNNRDDNYRLVDVCLATSAAPLFRSLAAIEPADGVASRVMFADGGLWANNPVLVGMIEALQMGRPDQPIEIFCLGTCSLPAGEDISQIRADRGLLEWRFGGEAAKLAIDAQQFAYDHMARMLSKHVNRPCQVVRFPSNQVPAAMLKYLDLDDTRSEAADALLSQARADADMTNSRCSDPNDREGVLVNRLFISIPPRVA